MGWKKRGAVILAGILLLGSSLPVCAEETEPAGYHVYEVQENEASDTWYGIARGDYLQSGNSSITKKDSTHAVASGIRPCE